MTTRRFGILLGTVALLATSAALRAQPSSEVSDRVRPQADLSGEWYGGPHLGYTFIGDHSFVCKCEKSQEDYLLFGARFGRYVTDHLAVEATAQLINLHPSFTELTVGGLWDFTPSLHGWNSYVGAGVGAARRTVFVGKGTGLAYLALGSEYRFDKSLGLRLELKGQYAFRSRTTERTTFGSIPVTNDARVDVQPSVGVLFHFGGKPTPVVVEPPPAMAPPPAPAPPAAPKQPEPAAPPPPVVSPPPPEPAKDTVQFERQKFIVSNVAKAQLDDVALRLRERPKATVVITGYADPGKGARGERLARQRAENLKRYLIDRHHIDASRITAEVDLTGGPEGAKAVVEVVFPKP